MPSEPWTLAIEGALLLLAASLAQRFPQAIVTIRRQLGLALAVLLVTLALFVPLLGYSRTGPERFASRSERPPVVRAVSIRATPAPTALAPRILSAADRRTAGVTAAPSASARAKAEPASLGARRVVFEPARGQSP